MLAVISCYPFHKLSGLRVSIVLWFPGVEPWEPQQSTQGNQHLRFISIHIIHSWLGLADGRLISFPSSIIHVTSTYAKPARPPWRKNANRWWGRMLGHSKSMARGRQRQRGASWQEPIESASVGQPSLAGLACVEVIPYRQHLSQEKHEIFLFLFCKENPPMSLGQGCPPANAKVGPFSSQVNVYLQSTFKTTTIDQSAGHA